MGNLLKMVSEGQFSAPIEKTKPGRKSSLKLKQLLLLLIFQTRTSIK